MRNLVLAALAATSLTTVANAAVITSFEPGAATPSSSFRVIDTFDDLSGITSSTGTVIVQVGSNGQGAQPANSNPPGTSYLSVLGGATATIMFDTAVKGFQFDWGSIDDYNTLTVFSSIGNKVFIPGTASFPNAANGNQISPSTNGRFTVRSTDGTTFTGFEMASSTNSFEIDNLAVVPEPATWAMLIAGFGLVGAAMRRQRQGAVRVSA